MRVQQLMTVFVQNLHDIQWYHTSRWISSIKKIPSWWDVLHIWHGYIITQHLMHSTAFLLLMDWHACVCVPVCLSVCWSRSWALQIAELLKLPFRLQSYVDPRNHILHIVGVHIGDFWWIRWIDLSVCMLVTIVSPANIAELLNLPFRLQSFVDPRNHINCI